MTPLLVSGVSCGILSEPRRGASSVALTAGVRPRVHPRLHYSVLGAFEYPVLLGRTDYTRGLISTSIVEMSIATPLIYIIFTPHSPHKHLRTSYPPGTHTNQHIIVIYYTYLLTTVKSVFFFFSRTLIFANSRKSISFAILIFTYRSSSFAYLIFLLN